MPISLVSASSFPARPAVRSASLWLMRGGYLGGLAAWLGFTLPSAIALVLFAFGASALRGPVGNGLLHGLKLVAVAIVAQAVLGMARSLCPDKPRASIATLTLVLMMFFPGSLSQIGVIVLEGVAGLVFCRSNAGASLDDVTMPVSRSMGVVFLVAFFLLLALAFVPCARECSRCSAPSIVPEHLSLVAAMSCCRCCAAPSWFPGWVSDNTFLAGYGAAQAVPGPLFTVAAYLGAVAGVAPAGLPVRQLPSWRFSCREFLTLMGTLPFGMSCAPGRERGRRWRASMPLSSVCSALRFTIRYGQVRCRVKSDFAIAAMALLCSLSGMRRLCWLCCSAPQRVWGWDWLPERVAIPDRSGSRGSS